ncbi:MAG: hypothetical protein AAGD01_03285 [Acidobacteriota bacterium]
MTDEVIFLAVTLLLAAAAVAWGIAQARRAAGAYGPRAELAGNSQGVGELVIQPWRLPTLGKPRFDYRIELWHRAGDLRLRAEAVDGDTHWELTLTQVEGEVRGRFDDGLQVFWGSVGSTRATLHLGLPRESWLRLLRVKQDLVIESSELRPEGDGDLVGAGTRVIFEGAELTGRVEHERESWWAEMTLNLKDEEDEMPRPLVAVVLLQLAARALDHHHH